MERGRDFRERKDVIMETGLGMHTLRCIAQREASPTGTACMGIEVLGGIAQLEVPHAGRDDITVEHSLVPEMVGKDDVIEWLKNLEAQVQGLKVLLFKLIEREKNEEHPTSSTEIHPCHVPSLHSGNG